MAVLTVSRLESRADTDVVSTVVSAPSWQFAPSTKDSWMSATLDELHGRHKARKPGGALKYQGEFIYDDDDLLRIIINIFFSI